jgi:hypothetical protein
MDATLEIDGIASLRSVRAVLLRTAELVIPISTFAIVADV